MIWGYLVHLSFNMWADRNVPELKDEHASAKPYLRFDKSLWNDILKKMAELGLNMVVIDLGDAVRYKTHPEIAVKDAWSVEQLKDEISKARDIGIEPIPKLNFSTCHDAWLGPYSRCVSTKVYYEVCKDLISEVVDIFEKPRFFHLGMDEETAEHQRYYDYVVVRQFDLWWHDLLFLLEEVKRHGVRPWIWSDSLWRKREEFFKKMPKEVVQSNWYYDVEFNDSINYVRAYLELEAHGYDQIPTGSNYYFSENFPKTVSFCKKHISRERLLGFLQTSWKPTLEEFRQKHIEAIELVAKGMKEFLS
ncbi:MAG: Tat pathway signal protein [Thermoproteota archaeon]